MVKPESIQQFTKEVIETFGFLMAQKIAESPLTPKDTGRMAKSFPATFKLVETGEGYSVQFTPPFYTKFVHEGTVKMRARPFINQIIHKESEPTLKKAFRMVDAKYKNR